jgi:hypothetical protein
MNASPIPTGRPAVSDIEASDDAEWFEANPRRLFRARRGTGGYTIIRRAPDVILRTVAPPGSAIVDADIDLAILWFSCAYPSWNPEQVRKRALKTLKHGVKK